jgi:tRNA(Ile)-lysidine synthase TilS/MesJ
MTKYFAKKVQKKCIFCRFSRFFAKKTLSLHEFSRYMQRSAEEIELVRLRSRMTKRFHKACADYGLIADGDHILVGVSGGKDSLALVELLGKRAQVYVPRFKVTAVYVRLKERSYQSDIAYLERHCASVRVPLVVRDTEIGAEEKKDPCFLCSWYRRKALFDVAQELGCNKIALGHHKDDIVETLLMNLIFQGSVGTIPPLLQMEKMPIQMIRPLCLVEEREIARYAELSGYEKQLKACPFEKESSRTQMKQLVNQLERLNPNVRDSIWGAMENIKTDYLPKRTKKKDYE